MTNTTQYQYGKDVAEVFKHSEDELQALISKKEREYYERSEGLHFKGLAAHVDFVRYSPLEQSLPELQQFIQDGYTMGTIINRPLYLHVILRKPSSIIEAELPELTQQAEAEYAAERYQRNVVETQRLMEVTIARRAREAAAKAAEAAAKAQATEEKKALADLLAAYHKPEVAA
ncbi:hypothetical protein [Pseudomonas sp. R5(2019)]|uniref:hypothetical protein n=1 Tax=Pseudomonas sp. R5(2019) TaxID=2697566 RepID=UPI001411B41E|nr:hypothetical protein [Pseudomonas sp. R5(2019)]NBA95840.1 hypothetical protein [Pseudomonas sp. R5(2019)]